MSFIVMSTRIPKSFSAESSTYLPKKLTVKTLNNGWVMSIAHAEMDITSEDVIVRG